MYVDNYDFHLYPSCRGSMNVYLLYYKQLLLLLSDSRVGLHISSKLFKAFMRRIGTNQRDMQFGKCKNVWSSLLDILGKFTNL